MSIISKSTAAILLAFLSVNALADGIYNPRGGPACSGGQTVNGLLCTATPTLGASGTLGSVTLGNATSGLLTLEPTTGALGTVTVSIPAATDTLVNLASTQTLSNKTLASPTLTGTVTGAVSTWTSGSTSTYPLTANGVGLGTTLNNTTNLLSLYNTNNNGNYLNFEQIRTTAGTSWTTATTRIQELTDSTNQGYMDFNPVNGNYGLAFGTGSGEIMRLTQGGFVGIGTTSPGALFTVGNNAFEVNLSGNIVGPITQFGVASATPAPQTLQFGSGSGTNIAGANATIDGSLSTGTGTPGNIILATGFAGLSENATVTITNASPTVITYTGHGLVPGAVVQFSTTGALPTGLSTATNYYVLLAGLTANAFEVSASPGGAAINTSSNGSGVQTATTQTAVTNAAASMATFGPSGLTGSAATPALFLNQSWNTSGSPILIGGQIRDVADSGASYVMYFLGGVAGATLEFDVSSAGNMFTAGTATIGAMATGTGSYVCATAGLLTVEATACPASDRGVKVPMGQLDLTDASARLDVLSASIYRYQDEKTYGRGERVGLYAQDVEAMDPRCASYDNLGKLETYDDRCVIAYLVADRKVLKAEIVELQGRLH